MKKIFLIMLCVICLCSISLSGCSTDNKNNDIGAIGFNPARASEIGARPVFEIPHREKADVLFPELIDITPITAIYENGMYVHASSIHESTQDKYIYYLDFDNETIKSKYAIPENLVLHTFITQSDGSILAAGLPINGYNEQGVANITEHKSRIYHITENSAKLLVQSSEFDIMNWPNLFTIDEQRGYIYTLYPSTTSVIKVYSTSGELLSKTEFKMQINDILYSNRDDTLYITLREESETAVAKLETPQMTITKVASIPILTNSVHPCEGGFFIDGGDIVYRFQFDTNTYTEEFVKSAHGLYGSMWSINEINGRYIVLDGSGINGDRVLKKLAILEDYNGPVEMLRIGFFNQGSVKEIIADFNFFNPQYYIEIEDYSKYGNEASTRMHMDIINGEGPDILMMSDPYMQETHMPIHHYIANGALVDIAPYMARDLDINNYWGNIINLLYMDSNTCYIAVPSFSLHGGLIGNSSVIEKVSYSNIQEMFKFFKDDFESQSPMMTANMMRERFVADMVQANMIHFVDYNSHTTTFENSEFITLLEAALVMPHIETPDFIGDYISLARKESNMSFLKMRGFGDYETYAAALYGDFKSIGFPNGSNDGGTAMVPQYLFGISSATQNIEGAWAFLRFAYEYDNLHTLPATQIPVNKASFNDSCNRYLKWQEYTIAGGGSSEHGFTGADGITTFVPPITIDLVRETVANTTRLIENIDRLYLVDTDILNIIYEELPAFFAGTVSAKDTARTIQSRSQTYIWELK